MDSYKKVSIIIPCRNEGTYILELIESILNNDYPKEMMEIIIVDGMSIDNTRSLLDKYVTGKDKTIKILDNKNHTVPYAMNIAIIQATGDIIIRMDAHSIYPPDYISKLVFYSKQLSADNVGGVWETLPANGTLKAKAIAFILSHPFGVGNAEYRINNKNQECIEVDTVPFGCYKRSIFDKIGLYDTDLTRNQDNELNERILKSGGKIYLIPSIKIKYFARENYTKFWKMLFQYAYFGPLVDIKLGKKTRLRRYIPSIFVISLIMPSIMALWDFDFILITAMSFGLHTLANIYFSTKLAIKENIKLLPNLLFGFLTGHLSYGIGYLKGFIDFNILSKHKKSQVSVSLSR